DIVPEMVSLMPHLIYHLDEPDADPAIFPSYLISKLARDDGTTVLLSGTGGDEVFFGYRGHQAYRYFERLDACPRWLLALMCRGADSTATRVFGAHPALPRRLRRFRRAALSEGFSRYLRIVDWSDPESRERIFTEEARAMLVSDGSQGALARYFEEFEGQGELNRYSHVLTQTFLASHNCLYTDKTSMAVGVEVRLPFVDREVLELGAQIPEGIKIRGGVTKWVLKKAMERYLPKDVLYRSKTGFGVPLRKWIA